MRGMASWCEMHRWLVRNVLSLHQCLVLVVHQWKSSQGQNSQPAPLPLFLHHHCMFHKHSVIFAWRVLGTLIRKALCTLILAKTTLRCYISLFADIICEDKNSVSASCFENKGVNVKEIIGNTKSLEWQITSTLWGCHFRCCRLTWLEGF